MDSGILVETRGLTKRYGSRIVAVEDLNLTIRRGEVYGFLGPNGAGKTTTLRMLLGLVSPTAGTATVLDERPGSAEGLARIGALVETPGFYPYLSGRRNLRVMARYSGVSASRVEAVLERVGLSGRSNDKFRKYSLGMKQRLGVAAALLKDPELLILDEPTNGLDPRGVAEMRTLIRTLGQGEHTVLLSSHLLPEVEQVCDRVGVIRSGRLVSEGGLQELRGEAGLLVRADPMQRAYKIVEALCGTERVKVEDGALVLKVDPSRAGEIGQKLITGGVIVRELRPVERSLEEAYLELTEKAEVGI